MNEANNYLNKLTGINDHWKLAKFIEDHAYMGEPNAQYALGLMYAEGRGVVQNPTLAYAWLTVAMFHGDWAARDLRILVKSMLDNDDLAMADNMAARLVVDIGEEATEH